MSGTRVRRSGSARAARLGAMLLALMAWPLAGPVAARPAPQEVEGGVEVREGEGEQERKEPAWRKKLDEEYPEAPADVLDGFLAAVRSRPDYQVAQGLRKEPVVAAVAEWSGELDLLMFGNTRVFAEHIEGWDFPAANGERFTLREVWWDIEEPGPGDPMGLDILTLSLADDEGYASEYRVSPDRLHDLRFSFALQVVMRHALYRKLERHSVQRETITEVMDRLCRMAGVEFSYSSAQAGDIRITQELRNRTIQECLEQAARVAGFEVLYRGTRHDSVDFDEVRDRLAQLRAAVDPTEAARIAPMDVLKELVWKKSLDMKEDGLMVTLAPGKASGK